LLAACEIAGVSHRVADVPKNRLDDPDIVARYGETMIALAKLEQPSPFFDSSFTERRLDYKPTPLAAGVEQTINWMRCQKLI